jgi:UDP-N-acetylmuramate dehydrogenase
MPALRSNILLADKTTYGIGGPARAYVAPATVQDIIDSLAWARENKSPLLVLGNGSNILVSDKGWDGLVVDMAANWSGITWDGRCATCSSGALLHTLVKESVGRGLCGLEKLGGIPGSVGGAVIMNAGAFGQSVSDCLESVDYIELLTADLKSLSVQELGASYRNTVFKNKGAIVVSARFRFGIDEAGQAPQAFREVLAKRKDRHPLDLPNCGSVFKNPPAPGATAGTLIEQCGLKGEVRGDAQVSVRHANFIVNRGFAKAEDVRALIAHVQKTVYEKSGILLDPEVVFAGEFSEPLFIPLTIR